MSSKNLTYLCLILLAASLVVTAWYLRQPLPDIPLPRLQIDDRISLDPEINYEVSAKEWNEKYLVKFDELPIDTISAHRRAVIYRFILFPTFNNPISVRAESIDGKRSLTVKILNGVGGYGIGELGELAYSKERTLSDDEWSELERLIDASSFWYAPRIDRTDLPVTDGALWILEGATAIYHKTTRVTPKPKTLEVMVYMLRLAGFEMEYEGYYQLQ